MLFYIRKVLFVFKQVNNFTKIQIKIAIFLKTVITNSANFYTSIQVLTHCCFEDLLNWNSQENLNCFIYFEQRALSFRHDCNRRKYFRLHGTSYIDPFHFNIKQTEISQQGARVLLTT